MKRLVGHLAWFSFVLLVGVAVAQEPAPPQQSAAPTTADKPSTDKKVEPEQPIAPLYQPETDTAAANTVVPDTNPLSGIMRLTLGTFSAQQNIVKASFHFGQIFDSNPSIIGHDSNYTGISSFGGSLGLQRTAKNRSTSLSYSGSTIVYNNDNADVKWVQQFSAVQSFTIRRWTLSLTDSANYTPEGAPNQALGTGLGNFSPMNSTVGPNDTILTPLASRLMNTAGGQLQYGLSPRSSWTAAFTYGSLFYPEEQFANTHQIGVRTGYNRNLNATDTASIFYEYNAFRGKGFAESDAHSVQVALAKRIAKRLTASIAGGPQIMVPDTVPAEKRISWTTSGTLQYQRSRTGVALNYSHAANSGGGVLSTVETDQLQVNLSRALTRQWNAAIAGMLAKNSPLAGPEFRSGGAKVELHRSLGEHAGVAFNYTFQRQIVDGACSTIICMGLSRHVFGFNFDFTPRSWVLR